LKGSNAERRKIDMKEFPMRFVGKDEIIYEVVREKAFADSRAAGKDVSRHSLMLELLHAGMVAKQDDPEWKAVIEKVSRGPGVPKA
jgi:hypothetical protein